MMKKILLACLAVMLQVGGLYCSEQNLWNEDYARAYNMSQVTEKPMLIAFVGSDWCPWSQKLAREILEDPEFLSEMQKEMILLWIDFPERLSISDERRPKIMNSKSDFALPNSPRLCSLSGW